MSHPYIQEALARERQKTLLAQAEADHLARQARSHRRRQHPPAIRSSLFRAWPFTMLDRSPEEAEMSLFMDVHNMEGGVSASDVATAHEADLKCQGTHGVSYLCYWVNEEAGKIFCLVEAPDAETAVTVHREAHGLVADEIYSVTEHTSGPPRTGRAGIVQLASWPGWRSRPAGRTPARARSASGSG
jgi:hypothetical protein